MMLASSLLSRIWHRVLNISIVQQLDIRTMHNKVNQLEIKNETKMIMIQLVVVAVIFRHVFDHRSYRTVNQSQSTNTDLLCVDRQVHRTSHW
jgi:hypothetical protein